ncbi:hypothetical protein [Streptomyces sp. NPDC051636]|uniref:hypothetical protein n=1 Tax=Streptomyces sp. NPDC051636 TaxID=3365663 RepID=UPI0037946F73
MNGTTPPADRPARIVWVRGVVRWRVAWGAGHRFLRQGPVAGIVPAGRPGRLRVRRASARVHGLGARVGARAGGGRRGRGAGAAGGGDRPSRSRWTTEQTSSSGTSVNGVKEKVNGTISATT